jgi:hypothetical protein
LLLLAGVLRCLTAPGSLALVGWGVPGGDRPEGRVEGAHAAMLLGSV